LIRFRIGEETVAADSDKTLTGLGRESYIGIRPLPAREAVKLAGMEVAPSEARAERRGYVIELVTALVIGAATVGAAWATYQESLYSGQSLDRYNEAIAKLEDSNTKNLEALQGYSFDMITWMEWQNHTIAADKSTGPAAKVEKEIADTIFADFMEERMRDALAWAEEESQKQKKVVHPTDSDEYAMSLFGDTFQVREESDQAIEAARKASEVGDQYTLITVFFTIVLFFAGIATVFKRDPIKVAMLIMAVVILVGTGIMLIGQPVAG